MTIRVECPVERKDSEPLNFKAIVGFETEQVTYEWAVHGGTIIDGQGAPNVKIQPDVEATSLTATLSLKGGPANCPNTASCTLIFHRDMPKAYLFDTYRFRTTTLETPSGDNRVSAGRELPKNVPASITNSFHEISDYKSHKPHQP